VNKVLHPWLSKVSFTLSNLIVMMGKLQVNAPRMEIQLISEEGPAAAA
jgi:hypothetical protein